MTIILVIHPINAVRSSLRILTLRWRTKIWNILACALCMGCSWAQYGNQNYEFGILFQCLRLGLTDIPFPIVHATCAIHILHGILELIKSVRLDRPIQFYYLFKFHFGSDDHNSIINKITFHSWSLQHQNQAIYPDIYSRAPCGMPSRWWVHLSELIYVKQQLNRFRNPDLRFILTFPSVRCAVCAKMNSSLHGVYDSICIVHLVCRAVHAARCSWQCWAAAAYDTIVATFFCVAVCIRIHVIYNEMG